MLPCTPPYQLSRRSISSDVPIFFSIALLLSPLPRDIGHSSSHSRRHRRQFVQDAYQGGLETIHKLVRCVWWVRDDFGSEQLLFELDGINLLDVAIRVVD